MEYKRSTKRIADGDAEMTNAKKYKGDKMKTYKGFNKDMTCRGFRYEEGKQLYGDEEVEQIVKERDTYKRALKLAEELGELCAPASNYIQQAEARLAELKGEEK